MKKRIFLITAVILLNLCSIRSEVSSAATATYTYDSLSRLTLLEYDNDSFISFTYDATGNILQITSNNQTLSPGDIDGNGNVTLTDAILSLQVVSGKSPSSNVAVFQDTNDDNKIGMEEVIYIIQSVAAGN